MSTKVQRRQYLEVTSSAGAAANSGEFHLGGNDWDVQFVDPVGALTLNSMEGSNDKLNWNVMNDIGGDPITALGAVQRVGLERPKWLRFQVALDAGGPRVFTAIVNVQKRGN